MTKDKPIYILGISAYYHDSAAVLLRDGEIVSAVQEERFSRKKADYRFPKTAVQYCLNEADIKISDVSHVIFYENSLEKFGRLTESYLSPVVVDFKFFKNSLRTWAGFKLHIQDQILKELGDEFRGEFHFAEHHASHAASAFFPSPFKETAILTLDAVGEWSTCSLGYGKDNEIKLIKEMRFPHSLGMLYSSFTYYCGFKVNSGEYKLMGLAPYGTPKYADLIRKHLVSIYDDGSIHMDMTYFNYCGGSTMTSEKFHALFEGPPRKPETVISQKEMDLASSIQLITEEIILKMARYAKKETGSDNLVLAGGVALNCVANGKLLRGNIFKNIWVQPASGDAGGALGSALLLWHQKLGNERNPLAEDSQKGSFQGPAFDDKDIESFLQSRNLAFEYFGDENNLLDTVTRILCEEKIIGWFQGRMEYGPRALGSRSIIGDPRSQKMQQIMNVKIKFRESFRPFAPSVLKEHAHEIFGVLKDHNDPYMLFVAPVLDKWKTQKTEEEMAKGNDPDLRIRLSIKRSEFPAITHVDYSARIQTVDSDRHGRYYRLIKKFYDKTGCPMVVNTSFNIRGEPIVCDPEDAISCFLGTDMDCLVLGNYIIKKECQNNELLSYEEMRRESYKELHTLD